MLVLFIFSKIISVLSETTFSVTLGENTLQPLKWNRNSARNFLVCFLEAKEGISLPRAVIKKGKSPHKKPTKTQTATAKWAHTGICMENKSGLQWSYKETTGQAVYILQIAAAATEPNCSPIPSPRPFRDCRRRSCHFNNVCKWRQRHLWSRLPNME